MKGEMAWDEEHHICKLKKLKISASFLVVFLTHEMMGLIPTPPAGYMQTPKYSPTRKITKWSSRHARVTACKRRDPSSQVTPTGHGR